MPAPEMILPEFDMIDFILDKSTDNNWGIKPTQIFSSKLKENFTDRYQIAIVSIGGTSNPKYNFDNFNFAVMVQGSHPSDEGVVANMCTLLHDNIIGHDTVYFRDNEVSYQQFNSTSQPRSVGVTPENKPLYTFQFSVNRQIHVNYGNRIPI